jgi:hypothetical protein
MAGLAGGDRAMMFDLLCAESDRWSITDGRGVCPDCSALVPNRFVVDHVRWHETLICQLLSVCAVQDRLSELTLELDPDSPSECVRLVHLLQIEALRERS